MGVRKTKSLSVQLVGVVKVGDILHALAGVPHSANVLISESKGDRGESAYHTFNISWDESQEPRYPGD